MSDLIPLTMFGKGQVTLPRKWRDKVKTKYFVAEEVAGGLLIKPLKKAIYYEVDDQNFGLHFPVGIDADTLAKDLKKANERLS